jgi:hypothetical protein
LSELKQSYFHFKMKKSENIKPIETEKPILSAE